MQAVHEDSLAEQLLSLERKLAALRDVPQQLAAVLDSLGQVHTRLHELGPVRYKEGSEFTGSFISEEEAPAPPPTIMAREHEGAARALERAVSRASSKGNERATILSGICGHPVARPRGASVCSAASALGMGVRRPSIAGHGLAGHTGLGQGGRRPSIGIQAELANASRRPSIGGPPSEHASHAGLGQGGARPSNQGELAGPARHAQLTPQPSFSGVQGEPAEKPRHALSRRPSTTSVPSATSMRKGLQIMRVNSTGKVDAKAAVPQQESTEVRPYRRCLSLAENGSLQSQGSILSLWGDTELQSSPRFMMLPDSAPRLLWDVLVMLVSILVGVIIPFELAYDDRLAKAFGTFLRVADLVWVADIVLNFRTGYLQRARAVLDPWLIAGRYARSWLAVDLIAAWPLVMTPEGGVTAVLVLKLLRLLRLGTLFTKLQKEVRFSLLPLLAVVMVLMVSHIMSCAWRLAHPQDKAERDELWPLYVEDMYWVFMTVTTVGYGDITPTTTGSRLYAIVVMLIAPVFSGTIVSGMTHATKALFDGQVESRIADATRFMDRHAVPAALQQRVEQNLRHHLRNKHRMDPELFATLSPAVQRELSLTLLSSTVLRFPLFKGAQHGFVAELAQAHIWVSCLPGDIIVEDGQLMQEMFFLVQGRLLVQRWGSSGEEGGEEAATKSDNTVVAKDSEQLVEFEVSTGAWFGEACMFNDDCIHSSTIAATAESELAVLPAREFHRIAEKFPRLLQRHRQIQHALAEKEVSISQLEYRRGHYVEPQSPRTSRNSRTLQDGVTFLFSRSRSKVTEGSSTAWAQVTPQPE